LIASSMRACLYLQCDRPRNSTAMLSGWPGAFAGLVGEKSAGLLAAMRRTCTCSWKRRTQMGLPELIGVDTAGFLVSMLYLISLACIVLGSSELKLDAPLPLLGRQTMGQCDVLCKTRLQNGISRRVLVNFIVPIQVRTYSSIETASPFHKPDFFRVLLLIHIAVKRFGDHLPRTTIFIESTRYN
jgi:hypothetical protein